jgi:hypothetical protein
LVSIKILIETPACQKDNQVTILISVFYVIAEKVSMGFVSKE